MIIGTGIDMLEKDRVRRTLGTPHGSRFVERVLTVEEKELASRWTGRRLAEFVAGRFCAKEAVAKALGCGIGGRLGFHDIRIVPDAVGKPLCDLSAEALQRLGLPASLRIHLSITHSDTMAAAYAVAELPDV
jgi:holo-[acyl-carrier protein] synthase